MIISLGELKKYITADEEDFVLESKLQALELSIRKYTNNNFQKKAYRRNADIAGGIFDVGAGAPFKEGDTVQVSESGLNEGLYTIKEVSGSTFTVKEDVVDERNVLVTKVDYPMDVKMGAVNIIKWQLKNEAANSGDTSRKNIQSETISRHSVTYVTDKTEEDISMEFGVPKKYVAFLKAYRKARF